MREIVKIIVNVDLTEEDYICANRDFQLGHFPKAALICVMAIMIYFGVQFFRISEEFGYLFFIYVLIFLFLVLIASMALGWLALTRLWIPIAVRRNLRTAQGKMSATSYEIDDDSIKSVATAGHTHLKWSDLQFYSAKKYHLIIYISPCVFLILPTRFFSQGQRNFIIECLENHNIRPRRLFWPVTLLSK